MKKKKRPKVIDIDKAFQEWLQQVFVIEEYYTIEDLKYFLEEPKRRELLFEEFVQSEFSPVYGEVYVKEQLELFSEKVTH